MNVKFHTLSTAEKLKSLVTLGLYRLKIPPNVIHRFNATTSIEQNHFSEANSHSDYYKIPSLR